MPVSNHQQKGHKTYFTNHSNKAEISVFVNTALNNIYRIIKTIEENVFQAVPDYNREEMYKSQVFTVLFSKRNEVKKERIIQYLTRWLPWFSKGLTITDPRRFALRLVVYIQKLVELRNFYSHSLKNVVNLNLYTNAHVPSSAKDVFIDLVCDIRREERDKKDSFIPFDHVKAEYKDYMFDAILHEDLNREKYACYEQDYCNFRADFKQLYKSTKNEVRERFKKERNLNDEKLKKQGVIFSAGKGPDSKQNANKLTEFGLVFFISIFLERRMVADFLDTVYPNDIGFMDKLVKRSLTIYNAKPPKEQLISMDRKFALGLDILNMLNRVPNYIYDHLTDGAKEKAIDEEGIVMKRYNDRFPYLILQCLEYSGKLEGLQLMCLIGKNFNAKPYHKQFEGKSEIREIHKTLYAFDHLSDIRENDKYYQELRSKDHEVNYNIGEEELAIINEIKNLHTYPLYQYYPKYGIHEYSTWKYIGFVFQDESIGPPVIAQSEESETRIVITPEFRVNNTQHQFTLDQSLLKYLAYLLKGESTVSENENGLASFKDLCLQFKSDFVRLLNDIRDQNITPDSDYDYSQILNSYNIPSACIPKRIKKYLNAKQSSNNSRKLIKTKLEYMLCETKCLLAENPVRSKPLPKEEYINRKKESQYFLMRGDKATWITNDILFFMKPKLVSIEKEGQKTNHFHKLNNQQAKILQSKLALMDHNFHDIRSFMKETGVFETGSEHIFLTEQNIKAKYQKVDNFFVRYLGLRKAYLESTIKKLKTKNQIINQTELERAYYYIKSKTIRRSVANEDKHIAITTYIENLKKEPTIIHPELMKKWANDVYQKEESENNQVHNLSYIVNDLDESFARYKQQWFYQKDSLIDGFGKRPQFQKRPEEVHHVDEREKLIKRQKRAKRNSFDQAIELNTLQCQDKLLWHYLKYILVEDQNIVDFLHKQTSLASYTHSKENDILKHEIDFKIEAAIREYKSNKKITGKCKIKDIGKVKATLKIPLLFNKPKKVWVEGLLSYYKNDEIDYDDLMEAIDKIKSELPSIMKHFMKIEDDYQLHKESVYMKKIENMKEAPYCSFAKMIKSLKIDNLLSKSAGATNLDTLRNALLHGSLPRCEKAALKPKDISIGEFVISHLTNEIGQTQITY